MRLLLDEKVAAMMIAPRSWRLQIGDPLSLQTYCVHCYWFHIHERLIGQEALHMTRKYRINAHVSHGSVLNALPFLVVRHAGIELFDLDHINTQ